MKRLWLLIIGVSLVACAGYVNAQVIDKKTRFKSFPYKGFMVLPERSTGRVETIGGNGPCIPTEVKIFQENKNFHFEYDPKRIKEWDSASEEARRREYQEYKKKKAVWEHMMPDMDFGERIYSDRAKQPYIEGVKFSNRTLKQFVDNMTSTSSNDWELAYHNGKGMGYVHKHDLFFSRFVSKHFSPYRAIRHRFVSYKNVCIGMGFSTWINFSEVAVDCENKKVSDEKYFARFDEEKGVYRLSWTEGGRAFKPIWKLKLEPEMKELIQKVCE